MEGGANAPMVENAMVNFFNSFFWAAIGAIIGSFIGGCFTLIAVGKTHRNDLEKQRQQEESLIRGFLKSIYSELETLWEIYQNGMGSEVESLEENQPLLMYYPVTQSYFTVYDNNSSLIGKIMDTNLRRSIITAYVEAKGLLDSYNANNDMVQSYMNLRLLYQQTENDIFKKEADNQLAILTVYAKEIKKRHHEIKDLVNSLLEALQRSIG